MDVGELVAPNSAEDSLVGKFITDRYRVIKKLGEGGMGAVYLAEHVFIEKKVALKVLAPELARKSDLVQRFLQEARSASRIGHENVIDISDFGKSPDGFVFFAMEYLPGHDLGQAVRKGGPMPWTRAKPIMIQICKALRAAHNQGIVHRDMKPENVFLIEKEGRPDFVKLLDFGIAKVQSMGGDDAPKLTQTGMIFGTPEYMAPEQAEGKVCDARADVYASGCIMYHLLISEPPFSAPNFMAMLTKHLLEEPVKPSVRRPDLGLTAALDGIVQRALAKDREKRWQSMEEMMIAIEAVAAEPLAARPAAGVGKAGAPAATRQLGGSDGMPIIATSGRVSHTEMVSGGARTGSGAALTDVIDDADLAPKRGKSSLLPLVVGGLALGAAVAIGFVLMRGKGDTAPPAAATTTVPAGAATPASAAVAPPGAVALPAAAAPTTDPAAGPASAPTTVTPAAPTPPSSGRRSHSRRSSGTVTPSYRRVDVEPDPDVKPEKKPPPPGLKTPAELKGFPN